MAIKNCDHIVHLTCSPEAPATYRSCSGYLTAALNTDHTMMMTYGFGRNWDAFQVKTAKLMVNHNADEFIKVHGDHWFFCKCKTQIKKECEAM